MKITLPLVRAAFDGVEITDELQKQIDKGCQLYVYKDESSWKEDDEYHVFSVWMEYGKDKENALMFDVDLNDLEVFATIILKSVEMLRRDYSDIIKEKINTGALL
jgi:hypothetical protein